MSDASSLRYVNTANLPPAQGFYKGAMRYFKATNTPVISTGNQWISVGSVVLPVQYPVAADATTQIIFVADKPYNVVSVTESHNVVGSTSAAVALEKAVSGTAPGSGISMLSSGVASVTMTGGSNTVGASYTVAPTVTFSAPQLAGGVTAVGTAVLGSAGTAGEVISVTVNNPGTGYTSAPTVTFTPVSPDTSGTVTLAVGTAVISNIMSLTTTINTPLKAVPLVPTTQAQGQATLNTSSGVGGITVTNVGAGYGSVAPIIYISAPTSGGVQATATCTLSAGAVNAITIGTAGSGYDTPPQVLFLNASTLNTGDQLGLVFSGTVTNVDGVMTIVLQPL